MRQLGEIPRPPSAIPKDRELRCGETPCSICGSGAFSHRHGWRGHEFAPWSQAALIDALLNAAGEPAPAPAPAPTRSLWLLCRYRVSLSLLWLSEKVGGY